MYFRSMVVLSIDVSIKNASLFKVEGVQIGTRAKLTGAVLGLLMIGLDATTS